MSDDEADAEKMRMALAAIANEMHKLHNDSLNSEQSEVCENEDILNSLLKCKYSLKCRKEEIIKLKENLKTACFVAKTVSSAKENETTLLNNHLDFARNQYLDLVQQRKEETDLINKLTAENRSLRDKLEYFDRSIELGYQELQKVRNEPIEDVPTLQQLKKIILCCGQYYADYSNEHDECVRLEQKNMFLNTKIRILECNSIAPKYTKKDEMKHKGTFLRRSEAGKPCESIAGGVRSEYQMSKSHSKFSNVTMTKIELNKHIITRDLDLTSHLGIVKNLLNDQEKMLNELKDLSKEINLDHNIGKSCCA